MRVLTSASVQESRESYGAVNITQKMKTGNSTLGENESYDVLTKGLSIMPTLAHGKIP